MATLEHIPADESTRIEHIIKMTGEQLKARYPPPTPAFRGQHAKDHACVAGTFKILDGLPAELRVGVFAQAGREYDALIRYSNAAAIIGPDSPVVDGKTTHGGRGMAVKLTGVDGRPLLPGTGGTVQDFLMVNHPVFPFANVEDYEAITAVLGKDAGKPDRYFAERIQKNPDGSPNLTDPVTQRALRTLGIIKRIQSLSLDAKPPAFEAPPASPVDCQYFGAAPFLFGDGRAMRFTAKPRHQVAGDGLTLGDEKYLRTALHERLTAANAQPVVFDFSLQVRDAAELSGKIDAEIEDASLQWDAAQHPFVPVATITIPPQEFETAERRTMCEALVFTPWNGIDEHRPLGGINRLRRAVYEASAAQRHARGPGAEAKS